MNELLQGVREALAELVSERGALEFAALLEREQAPYKYDLLIGASWIRDTREFVGYFYPKLQARFGQESLVKFGGIIVLDPRGEFLREFNQVIGPVAHDTRISNTKIASIDVLKGYIFATTRPLAQAA